MLASTRTSGAIVSMTGCGKMPRPNISSVSSSTITPPTC